MYIYVYAHTFFPQRNYIVFSVPNYQQMILTFASVDIKKQSLIFPILVKLL